MDTVDALLKKALHNIDTPDPELVRNVMEKAKNADSTFSPVKKIRNTRTFIIAAALIMVLTTTAFAAYVKYNINKNGQTYGIGSVSDEDVTNQMTQPIILPELILTKGIDGTIGYVYKSDLDGEQPQNPEEVLEYMKRLEERYEEMRQTGEEYVRSIPLYAEDGETVIGEVGIGGLPPVEGEGREHIEATDVG